MLDLLGRAVLDTTGDTVRARSNTGEIDLEVWVTGCISSEVEVPLVDVMIFGTVETDRAGEGRVADGETADVIGVEMEALVGAGVPSVVAAGRGRGRACALGANFLEDLSAPSNLAPFHLRNGKQH